MSKARIERTKLLFVCSRNRIRSLTAENIFRDIPGWNVRSAGTQPGARIQVSEKHLRWADTVFVMERCHRARLQQRFAEALADKDVIVLDIPDVYDPMDSELVSDLWSKVSQFYPLPNRPSPSSAEDI